MLIGNKSLGLLILICCFLSSLGKINPARIFFDNMVLQLEVAIQVWDTADSGEQISVHFIWYQCESNAGEPRLYKKLFPQLIVDWRKLWSQGDFPLLWIEKGV